MYTRTTPGIYWGAKYYEVEVSSTQKFCSRVLNVPLLISYGGLFLNYHSFFKGKQFYGTWWSSVLFNNYSSAPHFLPRKLPQVSCENVQLHRRNFKQLATGNNWPETGFSFTDFYEAHTLMRHRKLRKEQGLTFKETVNCKKAWAWGSGPVFRQHWEVNWVFPETIEGCRAPCFLCGIQVARPRSPSWHSPTAGRGVICAFQPFLSPMTVKPTISRWLCWLCDFSLAPVGCVARDCTFKEMAESCHPNQCLLNLKAQGKVLHKASIKQVPSCPLPSKCTSQGDKISSLPLGEDNLGACSAHADLQVSITVLE